MVEVRSMVRGVVALSCCVLLVPATMWAQGLIPDDVTYIQEPINGRVTLAILKHTDPFCMHDALNTFRGKRIPIEIDKTGGRIELRVKEADYEAASRIMPKLVSWPYWEITMRYRPPALARDWAAFHTGTDGLLEFVKHLDGVAQWQMDKVFRAVKQLKTVKWTVRHFAGTDGKLKTGVDVAFEDGRHLFVLPGERKTIVDVDPHEDRP